MRGDIAVPRGGDVLMAVKHLLAFVMMSLLGSVAAASASAATLSGLASCSGLRLNSTGSCVRELQARLDADGASPHVAVDGHFGYQTLQAVENFQRAMGLPSDGVVGARTISALDRPEQEAAGIKVPGNSDSTTVSNAWNSSERFLLPIAIAICAVVVVLLIVAALCRVKILSVRLTWRGFEFHLHRHPSRQQVDAQARVLAKALEVEANNPGRLPGINDYMRGIERGD